VSAATLFAGVAVAAAAGVTGWLLLLRRQLFAADALSHVAFPAALAAAAIGVDVRLGLIVCTVIVALVLAVLGSTSVSRRVADDATIGVLFTAILAAGLFIQTVIDRSSGEGSTAATRALFGSLTALSRGEALSSGVIALVAGLGAVILARPLVFAWVTPGMAQAAGMRLRALEIAFMTLLALVVAVAAQAVGALLLLGLLTGPAAFARGAVARPAAGVALAALVGALATLAGLAVATNVALLPASSAIVVAAALPYGALRLRAAVRG